jgi:predicted Zn-dependent protease with MMP-like domain
MTSAPASAAFPADLCAPSLADIDALARAALSALPAEVRAHCPGLVIAIEDFPDEALLVELGVEDPFELTGVYEGVSLDAKTSDHVASGPDRVVLFRRPILDEWTDRGNVTLGELVAHVLVHEIAHHFGLSDEDIAAIDDWTQ